MNFSIDRENKKINVERSFAAPLDKVWAAWTESEQTDKWWAPKPWKADTKSLDFKEGGMWLYAMRGPEGEAHWARFDYTSINPKKSYSGTDAFCDEQGNVNADMPRAEWTVNFSEAGDKTNVSITIIFNKEEDLDGLIKMGFKEGFEAGLGNLDDLLAGKE